MKKNILLLSLFVLLTSGLSAKITLPRLFSDNMILQQQSDANIWGKSDMSSVNVTTSWNNKIYKAKCDKKGNWKVSVATPVAGGPYSVKIDDGSELTLSNVMIGEVWFCSGQSNMEIPMKGYKNQPIENANMDILKSTNSSIRLFKIKRHSSTSPAYDVTGSWNEANPLSVRQISATAYYFARLLNEILDVPVGIVVGSWGGSSCEAWMNRDMLKDFKVRIPKNDEDITSKNRNPTVLFNGMLSPVIGLTIKGVIWYQGEDNTNRPFSYASMFSTLINGWRSLWGEGAFPFYYCQIAPYDYSLITAKGKKPVQSALIREAQSKVEKTVKNTGMAVLLDAGLKDCIHPRKKKVAGERLALIALGKTYGIKGISYQSPSYKKMEIKHDTVIVYFNDADMWITGNGEDGHCFSSDLFKVAGSDKKFYLAKAWIHRSKVYVKCDSVKNPVAVRYAFDNYVKGDLFCNGLPLSSFRTDNWDE